MRNRLRLTTVPIQQTQLDLGDTGASPGDQEVFTDDVFRDGNKVGRLTGFAQLTFVAENSFSAQLVTTLTLPRGSITLHGAFTEDPSRRSRAAHGQARTEVTETGSNITLDLIL